MDESNPDNPLEPTYSDALDLRKPEHRDAMLVGRIREDPTIANGLNLWCVATTCAKAQR